MPKMPLFPFAPSSLRTLPTGALLVTAAVLAGCANSRGLTPHAQTAPDASQLDARQVVRRSGLSVTQAWPQKDWWRGWHDAQLDALIEQGLRQSPTLAQALARVHAAEAQAGYADADRGPTVTASAGYSGVRLPDALLPANFGGGKFGYKSDTLGQFKWDVDLWGGKRSAWEALAGEAQASAIDAEAARITLSTAIARTYAQLAGAWMLQDVATADVARNRQMVALQSQRVKTGLDNRITLQQFESELRAAEQRREQAAQSITHLQLALAQLAAMGPDSALTLKRPRLTPESMRFAEAVPDDASVSLMAHRPDVQAALLRVQASSRQIDAAKARFLPNISLGALAGALGNEHFDLFHLSNVFYQFGPSISLPIFENGRLRANLDAQDARYEAAVAQYHQTLLGAAHQVADSVQSAHALKQQVDEARQSVTAAQQAWTLTRQRRDSGLLNSIQVLQVQQQLLGAQQRLAQLQAQRMDNAIALTYALGGGYAADASHAPAAGIGHDSGTDQHGTVAR